MALLELAMAEAKRRTEMLPQEVASLHERAKTNEKGYGIHASQFTALSDMMAVFKERQDHLFAHLSPDLPPQTFAEFYSELTREIVGAHDIWRIFRYIIGQHQDEFIGSFVDTADLIAGDCYSTCMKQARNFEVVTDEQFREPPLVYFEAEETPSTSSRGYGIESLTLPLRYYRDQQLPIPIVLLPSDHATSIWSYCSLHHEVGHNVDQDLKLSGELEERLMRRLGEKSVPDKRRKKWVKWTEEILADTFGVLLGGAGFAHNLCAWLLILAPSPKFQTLSDTSKHPPHFLRTFLITALLRQCRIVSLSEAAQNILNSWEQYQKPDWLPPYMEDCETVAEVFIHQPLGKLGKEPQPLLNLVPDFEDDVARSDWLAGYFLNGGPSPPVQEFTYRLVPASAQLAVTRLASPTDERLNDIQSRASIFFSRIERPPYLAGADRRAFLRQLALRVSFK